MWILCGPAHAQTTYRNVALNAKDTHNGTMLPHATSNSETYYDAADNWNTDFIAINAINGARANTSHGTAYPSWGPWTKATNPSPWLKVTLDTLYEVDSAAFYIRADFNLSDSTLDHDTYWSSGNIVFSDSTKVPIKFVRKSAAQCFKFSKRETRSVMIRDLVWRSYLKNGTVVSDGWAGITEFELYGQKRPPVSILAKTPINGEHGPHRAQTIEIPSWSQFLMPADIRGFDVFTIRGEKIWSYTRSPLAETSTMRLPAYFRGQVLEICFIK
jgi:hypothetical protein